jgi:hypothetical protein
MEEDVYIYKVEVNLSKDNGTYDASLLRKRKDDCNDKWKISSCCSTSTLREALEWAAMWNYTYGK